MRFTAAVEVVPCEVGPGPEPVRSPVVAITRRLSVAAWRGHRPLALFGLSMAGPAVITAVGMVVDQRTLLGHAMWFKPFKCAVSFLAFGASLAWLLDRTDAPRPARWAGHVVLATSVMEVGLITFQGARGCKATSMCPTPSTGRSSTSWVSPWPSSSSSGPTT